MKRMLAAALAASMVMGLTACGGSQTADTKTPENVKEANSPAAGESAEGAGNNEQKAGSEMTWKLATDASKDYPTTKALMKFDFGVSSHGNSSIKIMICSCFSSKVVRYARSCENASNQVFGLSCFSPEYNASCSLK